MMKHSLTLFCALMAVASWCAASEQPPPAWLDLPILSDDILAGRVVDGGAPGSTTTFSVSLDAGVLNIQIDLDTQTICVRRSEERLSVESSGNTGATFQMLSEAEKVRLAVLANLLDENPPEGNSVYEHATCLIKHLTYWPGGMPLALWMDSARITIGAQTVDRNELEESYRRALADAVKAGVIAKEDSALDWKSLCSAIGFRRTACYPTQLNPVKSKCESVLVGGLTCRGRCGSVCKGLCSGKRYTVDCLNHDRCADVYGSVSDQRCNYIFAPCFDDCRLADNCVDVPGVWNVKYAWKGYPPSQAQWHIYPNNTFRVASSSSKGSWGLKGKNITLRYSTGAQSICSGVLSENEFHMSGTMITKDKRNKGTWSAAKTNGVLPATSATTSGRDAPESVLDSSGAKGE